MSLPARLFFLPLKQHKINYAGYPLHSPVTTRVPSQPFPQHSKSMKAINMPDSIILVRLFSLFDRS